MSRRNRNSRRSRRQTEAQREQFASQTSAQEIERGTFVAPVDDPAAYKGVAPIEAVIPPRPPRPFGEARVFRLDGGYKVTIEGDADAIEQEFSVSAENDQLHIFTADSAIERRIAKQGGVSENRGHFMTTPGSQRSLSPSAPPGVGDPVHVPGLAYDGTGPRPQRDLQSAVLREVGMDEEAIAMAVGHQISAFRHDIEEEVQG